MKACQVLRVWCWRAAGPPGWARPKRRWTVGILARATGGPVVVVRAKGQELPELPKDVELVDDPREGKGPVQGLAAGLGALSDRAEVVFVSSTDLPFLHPAF